jgi:hypothetical protein
MSEQRPIRTVSQLAAALRVTDSRAELLLLTLEFMRVAERAGNGYRATEDAWKTYPRPPAREEKQAA